MHNKIVLVRIKYILIIENTIFITHFASVVDIFKIKVNIWVN